jgi:hypothetical protein
LFQTPEFLNVKRYKCFCAKKFESTKIVSFQTPEAFSNEATQLLLFEALYNFKTCDTITKLECMHLKVRGSGVYERRVSVGGEGIHRFHLVLKGQQRKNFLPLNLNI